MRSTTLHSFASKFLEMLSNPMRRLTEQLLLTSSLVSSISALPDFNLAGGAETSSASGHDNRTVAFWQDYNYCQGRNIVAGQSWQPLQDASMVKLQVMHRHGARSPASLVPGDSTQWYQCGNPDEFVFMNQGDTLSTQRSPFMKEQVVIDGAFSYELWQGNCDLGELTSFGSQQLQQLGTTLREVYVEELKFLPAQMNSSFQISHTYVWRTRESVENLFEGLYPLNTRSTNQTLIMHVKPSTIEVMIAPVSACPKLANLTSAYAKSSSYAGTLAPYNTLQNQIVTAYNTSDVTGYNTTQALFDTASATYCAGLGLKGNLTADDIQEAVVPGTSAYHNIFRVNPNAEEVKRLAVGGWLAEILPALTNLTTPLRVYSAHDASLDMFLSIVADPDLPWPPFASNVLIETWQKLNGSLVVRMYYEGMVVPANPALSCDFSACPVETLQAFLAKYIPTNFKRECSLS